MDCIKMRVEDSKANLVSKFLMFTQWYSPNILHANISFSIKVWGHIVKQAKHLQLNNNNKRKIKTKKTCR